MLHILLKLCTKSIKYTVCAPFYLLSLYLLSYLCERDAAGFACSRKSVFVM